MYGLSDEEIAAIREGRIAGFAPAEVALLRMADAMADTPSNLDDNLYQELRKHFSEQQLIELAATAAPALLTNSRLENLFIRLHGLLVDLFLRPFWG